MKEDLLKIIEHFGINNQQRKLEEEIFELEEAITINQLKETVEYEIPLTEIVGTREHIAEEIADVMLLLEQFKTYYGITSEEITNIFWSKVDRTLKRIESGYYERNNE